MGKKIESMKHAINLLGLKTIKTWVTILAMSSIDDKPYELILTALIRARMSETLAAKLTISPEHAFTVGLFSALDAFLDKPLNEILATLPLADELHSALLKHTGELGKLLELVLNYERGQWQEIPEMRFDSKTLHTNYIDALRWTDDFSRSLLDK
jgi:EAL and modified HD-GYP domain-containing signal transduction protein